MAWCLECHQECDIITVDNGIGAYEFWGFPGFDTNLVEVSSCCETEFTEDKRDLQLLDNKQGKSKLGNVW